MPFAQLDNRFPDQRRFLRLRTKPGALAAVGLWAACTAWAHANTIDSETPGLVPHEMPAILFPVASDHELDTAIDALVSAELWDRVPDGWQIRDFWEEQDLDAYLARREDGRRGGLRSAEVRRRRKLAAMGDPLPGMELDSATPPSTPPSSGASTPPATTLQASTVHNSTEKHSLNGARAARPAGFAEFYAAYPKHVGKIAAERAWDKAVAKGGAGPAEVVAGAAAFAAWCERTRAAPKFIPHPATWLNAGRWADELIYATGRPGDPPDDDERIPNYRRASSREEPR